MSLTFQCGVCGHQYTVPAHMAGKWVRCKHCESTLEVPQPLPGATSMPRSPQKPLKQARPFREPASQPPSSQRPPTASSAPQPILADSVPEMPVRSGSTSPSRPASTSPTRPAPLPLRPTPTGISNRPRVSTSGREGFDKLAVLLGVGAVGLVFGVVVFLTVALFGSGSKGERETATGSSGVMQDTVGGTGQTATINFAVKPDVRFGLPRNMSSDVPGVVWKEVPLNGDSNEAATHGRLWVYLPAGEPEPGSLGCVLIGPAGSRMVHGMRLGREDQAEHYPYPEQGYAVVAFEIDGPLPDGEPTDKQYREAYLKFTAAGAGVANARVAYQYATTELPQVDRNRIFVAGHSSAGTVALLCAEHLKGLAGCVAYAPCSDVEAFLADYVDELEDVLPGARRYIVDGSPLNYVEQLGCPVLVFHAVDDRVIRVGESNRFSSRAKQAGGNISLELAPRGGHYEAMIDEGIEKAVAWMNRVSPPASAPVASGQPPASAEVHSRPVPPRPTPSVSSPPRNPFSHSVKAHVHFKIVSYPSGNAEILARDALRPVVWAEPGSIRVDRAADEVVVGVRITAVNSHDAKLRLERVGFVIGATSYVPVRN